MSRVVAASSAFPPVLSPVEFDLEDSKEWCDEHDYAPYGADPKYIAARVIPSELKLLLRNHVVLVDGGVRDNLGYVAIHKRSHVLSQCHNCRVVQLVSDGGATYRPEVNPSNNWISQAMRIIDVGLSEPDQLRIEALIKKAQELDQGNNCRQDSNASRWDAAFWSIQRRPKWHKEYIDGSAEYVGVEDILSIGGIPTRLAELGDVPKMRIINWGYLAAHYGLPFINDMYSEEEEYKKLAVCLLPFCKEGISDRTAALNLCPGLKPRKFWSGRGAGEPQQRDPNCRYSAGR